MCLKKKVIYYLNKGVSHSQMYHTHKCVSQLSSQQQVPLGNATFFYMSVNMGAQREKKN